MDFPRKRFIEVVKKYVDFRRIKEMQDRVKTLRLEGNLSEDEMKFIQRMEERMAKVLAT